MADRYQNRAYSTASTGGRAQQGMPHDHGQGDPLAELARLIGQNDPAADYSAPPQAPPRPASERVPFRRSAPPPPEDFVDEPELPIDEPASGPPSWVLTRANPQRAPAPEPDFARDVHPVRRYANARQPQPQQYEARASVPGPAHGDAGADRYDDVLYPQDEPNPHHASEGYPEHYADAGYHGDQYAYQDDYDDGFEEKPRRSGMKTVLAVLALAVVGTGAAFGYRTFFGASHSGEPPIIKADTTPSKVVPPSAENGKQIQDRMAAAANGAEQIVSREEQPVDVKSIAASGPRVVFPPLNQNANPPSTASVAPDTGIPSNAANGTIAGTEPRRIKTLSVRPDQPAGSERTGAVGNPPPAPAAPQTTRSVAPAANARTTSATAGTANAPLSLSPQAGQSQRTQVASTNPTQNIAGGYVVQVSSQRSEADARASFRILQGKFPSILGSRSPLIKRADLGRRGVYYRAMVGPFASSSDAVHLCSGLKAAGGQCVVQRN